MTAPLRRPPHPLWYVVHAETEASQHGLACGGQTDLPLSQEGMKEAARTAAILVKKKLPIQVIFCSALLRSVQMADFVHDKIPSKLRVIQELGERKLGRWEGERIERIPGYSAFSENIPGGESLDDFRARVASIREWLKKQPQPGLVVGHEFFGRMLMNLTGQPDRSLKACEILEISLYS